MLDDLKAQMLEARQTAAQLENKYKHSLCVLIGDEIAKTKNPKAASKLWRVPISQLEAYIKIHEILNG
jgi:hypothetical protein